MIKSVAFATPESELIVTMSSAPTVVGQNIIIQQCSQINQIKYIPPQFVLAASNGLEL